MYTLDEIQKTREKIERSMQPQLAHKSRRRVERRLAESLAAATSIAQGSALVMWLGNGDEKSNLDALVTWTGYTLNQLKLEANRQAIPLLLAELERALWAWEDQSWH
ncbi:MAG: hypothetical protein L0I84_06835 [Halomonas subglaciescola]|nr:hypothetical protein [Halomonas subglaciescola]